MLGFAEVADADLTMTPIGKEWMEADILTSKEIFAERARDRAPLVRAIVRALEARRVLGVGDEQLRFGVARFEGAALANRCTMAEVCATWPRPCSRPWVCPNPRS